MATVFMSWSRKLGMATLCAAILGHGVAFAADKSPCRERTGTSLKSVEVFDGSPEEMASLMPDEGSKDVSVFKLDHIYGAGRFVSIRCRYANGSTADVKLSEKVDSCKYAIGKDKTVSFICR